MTWTRPALGVMATVMLGATALLVPAQASACSRPRCLPEVLLPSSASGGATVTVPANLPALGWGMASPDRAVMPTDIHLRRDGVAPEMITTTFASVLGNTRILAIRPVTAWMEGGQYTLTVAPPCNASMSAPVSVTFNVGPAVAMPTTLGTLTLGAQEQVPYAIVPPDSFNGTCGTQAEIASREALLALSEGARPWAQHLLVQLLVDGQPRGFARRGDGATVPSRNFYDGPDMLPYVVCSSTPSASQGLSPGVHRFQYRGAIVGSDTVLLSNEVTGEIVCGPLVGDAGVRDGGASSDVTVTTDTGSAIVDVTIVRDNGNVAVDTGVSTDQGSGAPPPQDAGNVDAGQSAVDSGVTTTADGGGCSTSPRTTSTHALWMAAVAFGLAARRRRSM